MEHGSPPTAGGVVLVGGMRSLGILDRCTHRAGVVKTDPTDGGVRRKDAE